MFGIGYQELIVIMVVALVVVGPQRLPEMAGQVGKWVRDFRRMTADLTGEFEKTIAEVDDIKNTVRREFSGVMDEVEGVSRSVKQDLSGKKAIGSGAKASTVARANTATAKKPAPATPVRLSANNAPKALPMATKTDPLSDVSALDDALLLGPVSRNGKNGSIAPVADDALLRVRQRRATARYARSA